MNRTFRTRGFTVIELLAVLLISFFLLLLIIPASATSRIVARQMQNNTQVRGIHQGMVIYSQGNRAYFPGLSTTGTPNRINVEDRFKLMLDRKLFTPEYFIHPMESSKTAWQAGPFTIANYSYAMLQVPTQGGRYEEWANTSNALAIVLGDRNTGPIASPSGLGNHYKYPRNTSFGCSIGYTKPYGNMGWVGAVAHNDNSVSFETTHILATAYDGVAHPNDSLFVASGDDDAYLIHSGN